MPTLYVATSKTLGAWGAEVGVTKELYKIGLAEGSGEDAVAGLNTSAHAGVSDWKLVGAQSVEATDEAALISRLAGKESLLSAAYYPRLKSATGVFKVKLTNVERSQMMQMALAGDIPKAGKTKPKDVAAYLMRNALG